MKKKAILLVLLTAFVVITSCTKENIGPSRTQILTQNDWKFSAITSTDTHFQSYMDLVLKGSEFHFNADKTSILTYSNTGPSTYTWEFSPDEKSLLLTGSTSTISYELVALDASNLHFRTTSAGITVYKFIKK